MTDTIIEILIDESGSMGYMKGDPQHENKYLVDGLTRMTLIKKVMADEIIPTIDYATQIIIRTFRNNSKIVDGKKVEAIFTPIIYQGNFDKQKILSVVSSLQDPPFGGTPITAAINAAISDLINYPNSDRKIILLTDGEENGTGDYRLAAKQALELEGIPCKIFIVGIDQDGESEKKSKEIATGGYYNIKSKSFTNGEVRKVLAPLKTVVLQNTIQNIQTIENNFQLEPQLKNKEKLQLQIQPQKVVETVEEKIKNIKQESKKGAVSQLDELENKIKEQILNTQNLLSEFSLLKERLRVDALLETGINSTTLTIDTEYSENIRQRSESFLYKMLCDKHGASKVKWLNQAGESFSHHDFELWDENGKLVQLIECKGTAKDKPTFYLTSNEWNHFLEHKDLYQLYRIFDVDGEMNAVCIDNLLAALLNKRVVPYLLKIEVLKEGRVFLTLTN
ncbi:hypothetical protein GCM10023189_06940 [Nibrella saemangeumensis]|uniref:VWFA domain-containing protein n=1 Tax=Nibrella saemangeumensis TaxID=1084526 RepID=A0ABP8MDT3_9BACT